MSPLVLLYLWTYVPASEPVSKAREAAFIQTGIKQDFETLKGAAESRVPQAIRHAGTIANAVYKKEIVFRSHTVGDWTIRRDEVRAVLTWRW